jgi:solute carrier family 6 GABA transporter-like protein 6/8/11/12/13
MVDIIVTTIEDEFGVKLKKYYKKREILVLLICCGIFSSLSVFRSTCFYCMFFKGTFFLTLPVVCPGGMYYFTLLDHFSAGISVFYIAFFEIIAIVWIYGRFPQVPTNSKKDL